MEKRSHEVQGFSWDCRDVWLLFSRFPEASNDFSKICRRTLIEWQIVRKVDHFRPILLRWCSTHIKDLAQLIDVRRAWEYDLICEQFREDATCRPNVKSLAIVLVVTKEDLRNILGLRYSQ